ncbi:MAG: PDZ domain-containing protein [Gemmataceae bacterium]|nr:PDZ domain-containing protein [Gemmata sp.]MDW8196490.1 PDZ domain-containing protein [Gemmataceae bacterium]
MIRYCLVTVTIGLGMAFALKAAEPAAPAVEVPYRLIGTNHIMVRAKINGRGPFNLIMDTGAPAVIIPKFVAQKANAKPNDKQWADFESFQLEGGLKVEKVRARVEDIPQIEGMNSMPIAGVELHGVIGYELLARYRIQYDLSRDKLVFEPLAFEPPPLVPLGGDGASAIQTLGPIVNLAKALFEKPNYATQARGFAGIEYEEKEGEVRITRVIPGSPAAQAGLQSGDIIKALKTDTIASARDLHKALAKATVGSKWRFTIIRNGQEQEIVVELGKGL